MTRDLTAELDAARGALDDAVRDERETYAAWTAANGRLIEARGAVNRAWHAWSSQGTEVSQ